MQFTVERVMGYECYSIVTNVKSEEKRVSITATDLIRRWQFLRPVPLSLGVKVFLDRDTVAFVQPPSLNNERRRWLRKRHLKLNSRCLKVYRAYSISFNSSNVSKFFGVE